MPRFRDAEHHRTQWRLPMVMLLMIYSTAFEDHVGQNGEECVVGIGLHRSETAESDVGVLRVFEGADGERVGCDIEGDKGWQRER